MINYSDLKNIRLLYVENDKTLVNQFTASLKSYFNKIYVCKDGNEGLHVYQTELPDIVICGILMPGMNGLEMAKAIKSSKANQIILITSSFSDPNFFFQAAEIGIDAYLLKPLKMEKLLDKIYDLSKRLLYDKELSEQTEKLHIMMNSNPNMMLMVSEYGIEYVNQTLQDFVGYQPPTPGDYSSFCLLDYFQSIDHGNDMIQNKNQLIQFFLDQPDRQHILQFKSLFPIDENTTKHYSFIISMAHQKDTDYYIFSLANISELTEDFKRLEISANQDSLTGISNRAKYNQVIEHYIERSKCYSEAFSMIFFDIDHFKRVNDQYGHDIGDQTLKILTQLVSNNIRERDFFARWGGEEFIILLKGSTIESGTKTAEYLRSLIEQSNFAPVDKITCSFAVVDFKITDSSDCLLKRADVVLYRAKAAGRNCVKTHQVENLLDNNLLLVNNSALAKERRTDYNKPLILVADDDYMQRLPMCTVLEKFNFQVKEAKNGVQALEIFQQFDPDLVILDIIMPEMDGFETCRELRKFSKGKYFPILMLTGLDDVDSINQAYQDGATDFLSKPVNWTLLGYKVQYLLRSAKISQTLALREIELLDTQHDIINRLAVAAEHRDSDTGGHILRMSLYSFELCKAMGVDSKKCDLLLKSSPMHDVGKIGIADNILLKAGKLSIDEYEEMKKHTLIGAEILSNNKSALLESAYTIALTHHEKWDGSGYPHGLSGTDIPEFGRICAITDVFDALTSERPYKKPWKSEDAFKKIQEGAGSHFDPKMVKKFLQISKRILEIKDKYL